MVVVQVKLKNMINNFFVKKNIITYHRISNKTVNDPLSISLETFEKQIKFLTNKFNIISLDKILDMDLPNGNYIAITFDDGYRDNLLNAVPILEKYKVPATIYITSRFLEGKCEMWWYEIKKFIDENELINFIYNNKNYKFILKSNKSKIKAFKQISSLFKKLKYQQQNKLLELITRNTQRIQYTNDLLNVDDLIKLNSKKLITLGAHTHNHVALSYLNDSECLDELSTSKKIIEKIINKKVRHFAYPYGGEKEISGREPEVLKSLGYISAVTTQLNFVEKYKNYLLPRIYLSERDIGTFLILKLTIFYKIYFFMRFKLFKIF